MTKLRSVAFGIALALSLASAPARAQDAAAAGDGAWNTKYGMIFSVQNIFQNSSDAVIGDFGGGVGLQYNLNPQRAMRFSVNLSRYSDPAYETETTDLATGNTTRGFSAPPAGFYTSAYDVDLGAAYVMRLTPTELAPYLGIGGGISYFQGARKFENDTSAFTTVNVDDLTRTFSVNAEGTLGVEWRLHKSVSVFAEYGLGIAMVRYESTQTETANTSKTTGAITGTRTEGSSTSFFNFDTGLVQGGQLGLVAFF